MQLTTMPSPEYLSSSQPSTAQHITIASMCSAETSTTTSPSRISFSFNFCQLVEEDDHENRIPLHQPSSNSPGNTSPDFEFRVIDNGTILPSEMMMIMNDDHQNYLQPLPFLSPLYSSPPLINKHTDDDDDDDIEKLQSKSTSSSFWGGFKRPSNNYSDHHHQDITHNNLSYLFPIPVLPRTSSNERMQHNHNHKQQSAAAAAAPKMVKSSSLTSATRLFPHKQEVLLRKSRSSGGGGSYYGGGALKVSPVLHFRAPNCISKATKTTTTSLFGCFSASKGNSNGKKKNQI